MLVKFYVHSCICWWPATANKDKIYESEALLPLSLCSIISSEMLTIKIFLINFLINTGNQ